tara:strand:+ start:4051 stop:4248 length:198 start_codon:yes stop_codon:yes gene_type:complete
MSCKVTEEQVLEVLKGLELEISTTSSTYNCSGHIEFILKHKDTVLTSQYLDGYEIKEILNLDGEY